MVFNYTLCVFISPGNTIKLKVSTNELFYIKIFGNFRMIKKILFQRKKWKTQKFVENVNFISQKELITVVYAKPAF